MSGLLNNAEPASQQGQRIKGVNGLEIITGKRSDLLKSNSGKVFTSAAPRGQAMSFGGVDMVTSSSGERVVSGSAADDTANEREKTRQQRRSKNHEVAEVG